MFTVQMAALRLLPPSADRSSRVSFESLQAQPAAQKEAEQEQAAAAQKEAEEEQEQAAAAQKEAAEEQEQAAAARKEAEEERAAGSRAGRRTGRGCGPPPPPRWRGPAPGCTPRASPGSC